MGKSSAESSGGGFGRVMAEFLAYVSAAVIVPIVVALVSFVLLPASLEGLVGVPLAVAACLLVLASIGRKSHSLTTFGRIKSVDESTFVGDRTHCADCDRQIDRGLHRQFRDQIVLFGVTVYTVESGTNPYCPQCTSRVDPRSTDSPRQVICEAESSAESVSETSSPN